jgi:hypothetical protein
MTGLGGTRLLSVIFLFSRMKPMETSLHRALKDQYGDDSGGRSEVFLEGFRIDAVASSGQLIEIQSGALGPLRAKLDRLLPAHRMRVVKPVVVERRVVRRSRLDGSNLSARRSPKRGAMVDLFEDMVGLARVFPHPNLVIEVLAVSIDEIRLPRRRRPGYKVADRRLVEVRGRRLLAHAHDLWSLLPQGNDWREPFTTADLARGIDRPLWFAQRVAYCLRLSGAATPLGKRGYSQVYARSLMPAIPIVG